MVVPAAHNPDLLNSFTSAASLEDATQPADKRLTLDEIKTSARRRSNLCEQSRREYLISFANFQLMSFEKEAYEYAASRPRALDATATPEEVLKDYGHRPVVTSGILRGQYHELQMRGTTMSYRQMCDHVANYMNLLRPRGYPVQFSVKHDFIVVT